MTGRFIQIEGYRFKIREAGDPSASTTVLALHGFGANGRSFRLAAPFFSDHGIRTVAPDHLGFGDSDKPESGYSLELYAQTTMGVVDRMGLGKPFLLGHSAGGKVAVATMARHPKRFEGLILVNSGGFSIYAPILVLADGPLFHLIDQRWIRRLILGRFNIGELVSTPEQWLAFRRMHGSNAALDIDRAGFREDVRRIETPTLVLWGERDRLMPGNTPKRILRDLPHAQLVRLPDSGHTPMRDDPETFARHVVEFIRSVEASPPPDRSKPTRSDSND